MFTFELGQHVGRYRLALRIPLLRNPSQPIAPARVAYRNTQQAQQRLHPIDVSALLAGQPILFARGTASILLVAARHPHDPHRPRLPTAMRHQRSQQLLIIDAVGLGPPAPLLHRDARGVEHIIGDPRRSEQAVKPEAVAARAVV